METECREWANGGFEVIHIYEHIKNSIILRKSYKTVRGACKVDF